MRSSVWLFQCHFGNQKFGFGNLLYLIFESEKLNREICIINSIGIIEGGLGFQIAQYSIYLEGCSVKVAGGEIGRTIIEMLII